MAERVHVIVPGPLDTPTGGFRYDREMAAALARAGRLASLTELAGSFPCPDAAALKRACARVAALPEGGTVIVDGLAFTALLAALARRPDLRLIALVHHRLGDEAGPGEERGRALLAREADALSLARGIIVTGAGTARRLAALGCAAEAIRVVPPGVDAAVAAAPRGGLGADSVVRLLAVGSLIPRKGYDVLLRALALLRARPWRLSVVGAARDPDHARRLRAWAHALGLHRRIRWRGAVSAPMLEVHYAEADAFVLASRFEGYGMVFAEAMAHGLPVVATTVGEAPEIVTRDAGRLVPPGDAGALSGALGEVLRRPALRLRLRAGARAAMRTRRTWAEAQDAFVEAIDQLRAS